jgi:hypothetical protein
MVRGENSLLVTVGRLGFLCQLGFAGNLPKTNILKNTYLWPT